MLKLENVSKFYYNKGIIASGFTKVNLELKIGEFVAITGSSGSGKSTLLNVISGLDSYEEGEMFINGKETSHFTKKEFEDYRRKYIANIFQSFNLINSYTVYQNVELVMLLNGYKKHQVKKKVLKIIDQVGLTKFRNTKVSKLSGGQKQRVAIARAIVKETPIIVADEPTGNLDSKSANEVIEILKNVAKDKLVIIVTHNIEQVEQYCTRIIKMNDGKIIENTVKKEITEEIKPKESKYTNLSFFNKYRLGIRNTFNIFAKFCLLFAVFLFMGASILAEYAGFQVAEEETQKDGYSSIFNDLSENRLLIHKKDKTYFTNEDYAKIKSLDNIDYLVEDDIFLESNVDLINVKSARTDTFGDMVSLEGMSFNGNMLDIANFKGTLDAGRMPENENEMILCITDTDASEYFKQFENEILNQTYSTWGQEGGYAEEETVNIGGTTKINLKIVGIQYTKEKNNFSQKFYVYHSVLEKLRKDMNARFSTMQILINDKYEQYTVRTSKNVERGKAIIDDDLKYSFKDEKAIGKKIRINVSNIYYEETLNLEISNTYSKSNFKTLNSEGKYDDYRYSIFINPEDLDVLFNKPSYQSSIFVKDAKQIENTILDLENIGITSKKVTDFKVQEGEIYKRVIKIIKVIITTILIFALFFISYLIIKIILKSRNIYYTTLRMLGATYKNIKRILDIELFTNSTLSYLILILFIYANKLNFINIGGIAKLSNFLHLKEYVITYIIIIVISRLISERFSRQIFKDTAISTYNEEY